MDKKEKILKYTFEELKLIYDSAEKVTDRRNDLNKFNYSVCTALFLAIAFVWNWSITNTKYTFVGIFVIVLFSIIAVIFTFYWIRQIKDYKLLNAAKFKVINEMATNLYLKSDNPTIELGSFQPFLKEWEYLEDKKALINSSKQKGKSNKILKSGSLEFFIPQAFRLVFLILLLLSTSSILINFEKFIQNIKTILFL